ncbi:MAG TPA: hypothetical protein VKO85_12015 [Wenzhouxiangellaceae bacterium]|nr:hypothetical protein [Wenzhouxiangellaceae bacterium]
MINATSKFPFAKALAAGALLSGALFAGQAALACQTTAWSATSGAVTAGDPAVEDIARYQGLCGLEATGQGYVQDDSPGGIDRIVARFYVLNNNTATATIYRGFSATDGTGERFSVTLDDTGLVTLTDNVSTQSVSQSGANPWVSVEIDWGQGAGSGFISLSVDGQTAAEATGLSNSGTALQSIRLGNLDGAAGTLGFDSYESRRSTAVGRLCNCNANGSADDVVNIQDIITLVNDAGNNSFLSPGTPDCNEDGQIAILDIIQTVNLAGTSGVCAI